MQSDKTRKKAGGGKNISSIMSVIRQCDIRDPVSVTPAP